jgi:hypothetical protein
MVLHRPVELAAETGQVGNGTADVRPRGATSSQGAFPSRVYSALHPNLRHSYAPCRAAYKVCFFVVPGIPVRLLRTLRFGPLPATNGKHCKNIVEREIPGHFEELGIVTRILN